MAVKVGPYLYILKVFCGITQEKSAPSPCVPWKGADHGSATDGLEYFNAIPGT